MNLYTIIKKAISQIIFMLFCFCINAQNSVSISPANTINLIFSQPIDAGDPIEPVIDNNKWLNYNTTVDSLGSTLSISVELDQGTDIPMGMQLQLQADAFSGTNGGDPGTPSGTLTLSSLPQILIYNIGTCDSGSGENSGHHLTYILSISDYSEIQASSGVINLLYTISQ